MTESREPVHIPALGDALATFFAASREDLLAALADAEVTLATYQRRVDELQLRIHLVHRLLDAGEKRDAVATAKEAASRSDGGTGTGGGIAGPVLGDRGAEIPLPDPRDLLGRRAAVVARERAAAAARAATEPYLGDPAADWHRFKYAALERWLREKPNRPLFATFEQIEAIIGAELPDSCRKYAAHWHGWQGSAVARAIHRAGWRVRHLDIREETLMFVPDLALQRRAQATA